jgi:hypothetical protein
MISFVDMKEERIDVKISDDYYSSLFRGRVIRVAKQPSAGYYIMWSRAAIFPVKDCTIITNENKESKTDER